MHESSVTPESLLKLAVSAYDAASLAKEQSDWYAAMFAAIKQQSQPFTDAHKLASAGLYLAGDLANSLDCNCEELDTHIKRLTGAKDPS